MTQPATICVIDDNPDNVDLLEQELEDAGYRVVTAADGAGGLRTVEEERPDLVLLDVMMPDMSGYEVCRRLRQGEAHAALPVIMVTAKTGADDEVHGLDCGANDYVTKPINIETLLARVRTHLRIKDLQDELRRNYESYVRADRSRHEMISMLTHDMKTPLMTVVSSTKLLMDKAADHDEEAVANIAGLVLRSSQKLHELVEDFLALARWDQTGLAVELEACDMADVVRGVIEILQHLLRERNIHLTFDLPEAPALVFADSILISRVWQNLLSNAIKYNRPGGQITLAMEHSGGGHVICRVVDTGVGIPEDVLPRVFDVYFRPNDKKMIEGSGLGLAVVRAILRTHRSDYRIESTLGQGTQFLFNLPQAPSLESEPPPLETLTLHPLPDEG